MIFHQEDYAIILFDEDVPCVVIEWITYTKSQQFRDILNRTLEAYKFFTLKHNKLHWIIDARNFLPVLPQDIDWAIGELNPRLLASGLKYMAIIDAENEYARARMDEYINRTDFTHLIIRTFKSLEEAKDWLKTC